MRITQQVGATSLAELNSHHGPSPHPLITKSFAPRIIASVHAGPTTITSRKPQICATYTLSVITASVACRPLDWFRFSGG
jgi:hypothetical protein